MTGGQVVVPTGMRGGLLTAHVRWLAGAALVLGLGGCGAGSSSSTASPETASTGADGVQQVTVHGNDKLAFSPTVLRAHVGALRVTFINDGSTAHTFRVKGIEPDTHNVDGHTSKTITVTLPHRGQFFFQCDYHPMMVGTLDVS